MTSSDGYVVYPAASYLGSSYGAKSYGAKGDGVYLYDGAIESGTASFISPSASFAATDVGKVIKINGAGASSADLTTTILTYNSATSVTIATNASTTVADAFTLYGTDDTAAIQSAINAVFATTHKTGTLSFPAGVYVTNGSLQTSVSGENPNSQLYLPVYDNTVTGLPSIRFLGETPPFTANARKAGGVPFNDGVIIHSTLTTGSGTFPAVFGGCNSTVALSGSTFVRASFENIHVRVCSHAAVAGPVITGINGARFQELSTNDVIVDADCNTLYSVTVKPTNEVAGVIYPQINASNNVSSKNTYTSYFKYGQVFGELMTIISAISVTCNYGFAFTSGNYPVLAMHLRTTHCTNDILVASSGILPTYAGTCVFDVLQLDVEVGSVSGWQNSDKGLTDVDNNGYGKITHSYISGSTHTFTEFTKSGGTGVFTQQFGMLGSATTGASTSAFNLLFNSTSHATKGLIAFGSVTTGLIYNETSALLGVGGPSSTYAIEVNKSTNSAQRVQVTNTNTGTLAQAQTAVVNDGGLVTSMGIRSSGFSGTALTAANQGTLITNASASFLIGASSAVDLIFVSGGTALSSEKFRIDSAGNVSIGNAALATNATNGFLYIPTCAGTPTGVPTTKTGRCAMIFDTTNNKLYIYDGGWLGGTAPGAFS